MDLDKTLKDLQEIEAITGVKLDTEMFKQAVLKNNCSTMLHSLLCKASKHGRESDFCMFYEPGIS